MKGRQVRGTLSARSEVDLYNQLQTAGLELVQCASLSQKRAKIPGISFSKVKVRDLIQFFISMQQMQGAGVPMLDALADIRDATSNDMLRDMISELHRDVRDGASLSEAMEKHPKIFKPLYISLIKAGEDTGDLTSSYSQLEKFLKWVDEMQSKIKKATRYPIIVTVVVLFTIIFMMSYVVPQIVGFLKFLDIELPWYSVWLINTSNFFIGKHLGHRFFQKKDTIWARQLEKAHHYHQRYGPWAVALSRFFPFMRTLVPFAAGLTGMRFRLFTPYNVLGGLAWIFVYVLAGFFFGEIPWVQRHYGLIFSGLLLALLLALLYGMGKALWDRRGRE